MLRLLQFNNRVALSPCNRQVGNLDVTFTILTNDESGEIANSALSVIKAVEQSNTEKH